MIKKLLIGLLCLFFFSITMGVVIITYSYIQGPPEYDLDDNTIVYDTNNKIVSIQHGAQNRYWVTLDDISPYVIDAFISAEDQHFYDHFGFDFVRIAGAVYHNIKAMEKRQGASTITQQYARNIFLTHKKSWKRKIQEAMISIRLEMFQTKDEILEGYLNTIYFGHGQYGIQAASQYYFDKDAADLTISEAALIAGIPKGPSVYSPLISEKNAKERQEWILTRMNETGKITDSELNTALEKDVPIVKTTANQEPELGKYFTDYALKEAARILDMTREQLEGEGYEIYTTMDLNAQKHLEDTIKEEMPEDSELQVGAMTIEPYTGKIVALQGGRNFDISPFNRAINAKRQAGSTFKPFLYYAALIYGYTPSTTLESRPTTFELDNGKVYNPTNYNDYYPENPITLAQAIAVSDNIYAVKTNQFIGPENLIQAAKTFGIESDLPQVLSLALGSASVSVYEMTKSFSVLANEGYSVQPYIIEKIVDSDGNVVYEHEKAEQEKVLEENYAYVLTHLMKGMFNEELNSYMRVTGASVKPRLTREYAGKSGTTDSDGWMIGFSPQYTTTVWTGYDDNRELESIHDERVAKEIWATYMEKIHEGLPIYDFRIPSNVIGVNIDPFTGKLVGPDCERSVLMYYIKGTEPSEFCEEHE
ncbi:transglycosylase domain-containing protein [Bacillaceae bacterium W0354]